MADIKTITVELTEASLSIGSSIDSIKARILEDSTGDTVVGEYEKLKDIITEIIDKLDEVIEKVNE